MSTLPLFTVRLPRMTFRPLEHIEAAEAAQRDATSFGIAADAASVARWERLIARGEVWGYGEPIAAQCLLETVDHWLGGARVPALHVASVAVPPEHRGKGLGRELVRSALARAAHQGTAMSVLFPATTRMYRSLGYELAGDYARYRLDARVTPAMGPPLRPASGATDWQSIRACHERMARTLNGPAVRTEQRWSELRDQPYWYVADGAEGITAYLLLDHRREGHDWRYRLAIADWAATSPDGLAGLVGFVGRHGTLATEAVLRGPAFLWAMLLPEQDLQVTSGFQWMARGLDLAAALSTRGYPEGITATVSLAVEDPVLGSSGTWRLRTEGGRGVVEPAADADVRLDVRAVGPLLTGARSAKELALAGLAHGDDPHLETLSAAFAGPRPILLDFF